MRGLAAHAVFETSNSYDAGLEMGRHLIASGHRRVAFVSPFGATCWSKGRQYGLADAFKAAGFAAAVAGHTIEFDGNVQDYGHQWPSQDGAVRDAWRSCLAATGDKLSGPLDSHGAQRAGSVLSLALKGELVRRVCAPLFARAFCDDSISAVTFVNDAVAAMACDWLASARTARRLTMAAFDDTEESMSRGITSYNFNAPGIAQAMLTFVLAPRARSCAPRSRPFVVDGYVVARAPSRA